MAMVRLEPAGMAIVPDATPPATGILKINAVGMSGAHRPWVRSCRTRARAWIPARAPARVVWYGARGEASAVGDRARDYGVTATVAIPVAPWNVAAIFVEPTPAPV